MSFRVEVNRDPAVAYDLDVAEATPRQLTEVERRFLAEPDGQFVVRAPDGAPLGCASCVVWRDAGEGAFAWIGATLVARHARGRGIGRALMQACIAHADEAGARVIGLAASQMGRPMFERAGFQPLGTTARWSRPKHAPRPDPTPGPYSIYPISACEIMDLANYDRARFGANRAPWTAAVMARFPERAFVAFERASGNIAGIVLGQERHVGPLVADSPEAAARLLHAAEMAGSPPLVITSGLNPDAERVLLAAGYQKDGAACTLLTRGGAPLPGRPGTIYGLGSWAVG